MAAGHLSPVPRLAQIEGARDGFAQGKWAEYYKDAEERFQQADQTGDNGFDEDEMWARLEYEDSIRTVIKGQIEEYEARLMEDLDNRRRVQQKLGFTLVRLSPAAMYQLAAMNLASTDLGMKARYTDALMDHRAEFVAYVQEESASAGPGAGAVMIEMDSEKGMTIKSGRDDAGVDVSGRPLFSPPSWQASEVIENVMIDAGLMVFAGLLLFLLAFVSFVRFDVR